MTEQEWLASDTLADVLRALGPQQNSRRWRQFAVGCARLIWDLIPPEFRAPVEVMERILDRKALRDELERVHLPYRAVYNDAKRVACWASSPTGSIIERGRVLIPMHTLRARRVAGGERDAMHLERELCHVARDVFGNPFRPPPVYEPAWLRWGDGAVSSLAETIHAERAFEQMPILGDALEDAGCTEARWLEHCRDHATHVRGCWVLEAIRGRG